MQSSGLMHSVCKPVLNTSLQYLEKLLGVFFKNDNIFYKWLEAHFTTCIQDTHAHTHTMCVSAMLSSLLDQDSIIFARKQNHFIKEHFGCKLHVQIAV